MNISVYRFLFNSLWYAVFEIFFKKQNVRIESKVIKQGKTFTSCIQNLYLKYLMFFTVDKHNRIYFGESAFKLPDKT